ncbi:MAG: ABC transporter permease [Ardenticatenales bacterium]
MRLSHELNAMMAIAYRDLLKFTSDRSRIVGTLVFPAVFILILGGAFGAALKNNYKFDFQTFVFLGVFAQNMWQSSAMGLVSLLEDRENDFSQAVFVAPVSRYTIVAGKILGESLVALAQGLVIFAFGLLIGVRPGLWQSLALIPASILICLYGGAFGLIVMVNMKSQRGAQQIFPFVMLPQFFVAGVFAPVDKLNGFLDVLSRISPMRYAVDLLRGVYYGGPAHSDGAVLAPQVLNLAVMAVTGALFMVIGTAMFVRRERTR